MPRLLPVVAALIGLLLAAPSASAQSPAALAAASSTPPADTAAPGDALAPLLRVLQDEAARRRLVEALAQAAPGGAPPAAGEEPRAIDAATEIGTSLLSSLSEAVETLTDRLGRAGEALAAAPATVLAAARDLADPAAQTRLAEVIVKLLLILAVGLFAELIAKRLLRAPLRRLEDKATDGWINRVAFLLMRTFLDLVPIAVFAAAS